MCTTTPSVSNESLWYVYGWSLVELCTAYSLPPSIYMVLRRFWSLDATLQAILLLHLMCVVVLGSLVFVSCLQPIYARGKHATEFSTT
jgi:hypothetical protein